MEPLLLRLEEVTSGYLLRARLSPNLGSPLEDGLEEDLESFVDDTEIFCTSDSDFVNVDRCVEKFERLSGAILNRSSKSVVLGLGLWNQRKQWPLKWLKTVTETKVFGFILTNSYTEILEKNWDSQLSKFTSAIYSWSSRVLETLHQRAEVLSIFALSKIWYRAAVLPLPERYAVQFEKHISSFLWKGQLTRNVLSRDTVALPKDHGGLNLPHVRLKCKALFMKQLFRSIA